MKLKKGVDKVYSDDLYYDLFQGGYLKPSELLLRDGDIMQVEDAIAVVEEYLESVVINEEV